MVTTEPVTFDPYVHETADFGRWRRLRDEAPLYRNEERGFFMVSRHADCKEVLTDWRTYSSDGGVVLDLMKNPEAVQQFRNMLFEDPPVHTLHRRMLAVVFTPRRVAELETSVRTLTRRYLEGWGEDGYETIGDLGAKLPMAVIGALLGVPESDYKLITDLVQRYLEGRLDGDKAWLDRRADIAAYLKEFIDRFRQAPGDGLLSALANLRIDDDGVERPLTDDEAINQATVLALAGNETTTRLLGFVVDVLGRHPEARRQLVEQRQLIANAVEETLRYETPTYLVGRIPVRDVEWYGETVPAGSFLLSLTAAGAHDERVFTDPDSFDVTRTIGNNQLGFGAGVHYCLGAPLARLEVRVAIEEMLSIAPDWRCDYEAATFAAGAATRGWKKLPVIFDDR